MTEPYKFLGLPEPRPVQEMIEHAKAAGDASRDAAKKQRPRTIAKAGAIATVAGLATTGAYLLGDNAISRSDMYGDKMEEKYPIVPQVKEANVVEVVTQPNSLPENPSDLIIEVPDK